MDLRHDNNDVILLANVGEAATRLLGSFGEGRLIVLSFAVLLSLVCKTLTGLLYLEVGVLKQGLNTVEHMLIIEVVQHTVTSHHDDVVL